jgi:hypothetical protein
VFSVTCITLRAKPELMAHSSKACSSMTMPMPRKCLLGERWRDAYDNAALEEGGETDKLKCFKK